MKKVFFWFFLALTALLVSCKPEVDIFADYKQVPVIYGLLDANADTNYIKITRGFYATEEIDQVALNPDSSDYPGKLDVRLYEYCNGDSIREIILDTITIHNKVEGAFYAPHQKLYYTDVPLHQNSWDKQYSYKLRIVLPDRILTAETKMVGNPGFDAQSNGVDFSRMYYYGASRPFLFHPAMNAAFYEVSMSFTFLEQRTPEADSLPRTMHWKIASYSEYELSLAMQNGCYARISCASICSVCQPTRIPPTTEYSCLTVTAQRQSISRTSPIWWCAASLCAIQGPMQFNSARFHIS